MTKVNSVRINDTTRYIENISYQTALPTATSDSADFVSVNNELYAKQVNNGVYSYAKVGGDGGVVVEITDVPNTATSGTLTQDQVNTLLAHPSNYIQFFNENFYPQDVETSEGYIVYSHVGIRDNLVIIKNISLTISTRSWVLSQLYLGESNTNIIDTSSFSTADTNKLFIPSEYVRTDREYWLNSVILHQGVIYTIDEDSLEIYDGDEESSYDDEEAFFLYARFIPNNPDDIYQITTDNIDFYRREIYVEIYTPYGAQDDGVTYPYNIFLLRSEDYKYIYTKVSFDNSSEYRTRIVKAKNLCVTGSAVSRAETNAQPNRFYLPLLWNDYVLQLKNANETQYHFKLDLSGSAFQRYSAQFSESEPLVNFTQNIFNFSSSPTTIITPSSSSLLRVAPNYMSSLFNVGQFVSISILPTNNASITFNQVLTATALGVVTSSNRWSSEQDSNRYYSYQIKLLTPMTICGKKVNMIEYAYCNETSQINVLKFFTDYTTDSDFSPLLTHTITFNACGMPFSAR